MQQSKVWLSTRARCVELSSSIIRDASEKQNTKSVPSKRIDIFTRIPFSRKTKLVLRPQKIIVLDFEKHILGITIGI